MILLSVIIPVYNAASFLEECVDSLYAQQLGADTLEVLLIDDGSTDDSPLLMQQLARRYTGIRCLHQPNSGVSVARNHGLREAHGTYLLFIDADDTLLPHSLLPLLEAAQSTQSDIIEGNWVKTCTSTPEATDHIHGPMTGEEAYRTVYTPFVCTVWRYLYRTEFLREHHIQFLPGIRMAEDTEVTERCLLLAERYIHVDRPFYHYRQHEGSCLATMTGSKLQDMNTVLGVMAREHSAFHLQPATRVFQARYFFHHMSVVIWYLTHYRSLYPHSKSLAHDLLQKVERFPKGMTAGQRFVCRFFRTWPSAYLAIRHYLSHPLYD